MHNSFRRTQDPDTLGQGSRKSVGLGSGLRDDCAETSESQGRQGSAFSFTKNVRVPIRREGETEAPASQAVNL